MIAAHTKTHGTAELRMPINRPFKIGGLTWMNSMESQDSSHVEDRRRRAEVRGSLGDATWLPFEDGGRGQGQQEGRGDRFSYRDSRRNAALPTAGFSPSGPFSDFQPL